MNIDTNTPSTDDRVQGLPSRRRSVAGAPHPDFDGGPINILIVDDEPKNLTVLETILDNSDYRLIRAESADHALRALIVEEFALLILDIRMPGMTGFELADMIKKRKKTARVPIIFLTAYYLEDQHVIEGYEAGAVDYLLKPVNPTILRSKVSAFAELHRKNRALLAEVNERRRAEEQLHELNETLEQRVTERTEALQKTSAALHETAEQYRSLFEGSLDAIFFLGADECFKAANPAALRFFDHPIEELKNIHFLDLCTPGQHELMRNAFQAAFQGQGFTIDTTVITVSGERRDLFISGAPSIQDGEVVGISCIARDITERILTEKALRLSETRYRELIEALPAAVYTTDRQGRILLYNKAAVGLWGQEPAVGKDLWCGSWKIYQPDGTLLPLDECPMAVTLREGRAIRGVEIVIERPDRTRRHVLPHPEPIFADGLLVGAINMLIDITDRKEGEKAMARLAAIVTSSDDAIIGKDLRGIVTSWNGAAEQLFGYTAEEMIGQPILRLIPPDRRDEETHILGQVARGEAIKHYETVRRCKDGTELTVSLTVSPVFAEGRIIGASKIVRDITEQKRIEIALRRSERNLSDFFDNASVGLHWVGPDGLIIKANQTELDMLGYSRDEYLGHHIAEFHVDQPAIHDILYRLSSGDTLREYPARIRSKNGSVLDVLISSNALFENDTLIHTRCFTRDITDRKRAEEALRENEERLRMAQQAGKIGAFDWNMKTGVNTWSNELEALYGLPPGGFPGTQGAWENLVHAEDRPDVLARVKHSIDTGKPGEAEFRVLWPDGSTHWLSGRWKTFTDETGSPFRLTGVNIDLTARRQAEAALQERDRALTAVNAALERQALELASANKELEKFSYSVSHDLRAPLRTIDAFSRILEEDHAEPMDDKARRCISIVRKAVGQAGELIDDLLELSKLGRQGMTLNPVAMEELARETADELKVVQEGRTIDLSIGNLPPCQGDRRFLKLVWTNLLTNAFKYSKNRNQSRIEIGWMPDDTNDRMVIYYVKDNGVGFNMKYAHKLFGVFQRLHRQEDFDGTGVGLAVVQRIVQRHEGRVWAEGKVDEGATFFFSIRKADT